MNNLSLWLAFGAGILSFVSPCTLPLFPSYIGYISGVSYTALQKDARNRRGLRTSAFLHALCFCVGLSILFVLLGWGATLFGGVLGHYRDGVRIVGGILIILMGLFMAGVVRSDYLMKERRFLPRLKPVGYIGSVVVGIAFAAGWTPCIGPILGSVLAMIVANPSRGTTYMIAYAIGFSVPFLILAVTMASVKPFLKYTGIISRIGGWVLVLMGVLLVSDKMEFITVWIQRATGYTGF